MKVVQPVFAKYLDSNSLILDHYSMVKDNMMKWVALLRGVNVGGVKVYMESLRKLAEVLGWTEVKTYIASGNMVFSATGEATSLAEKLRSALQDDIGVNTPVIVLSSADIQTVLAEHPWHPEKGNQSHVYFCWGKPVIDEALYGELKVPEEELRIIGGHVHFYAPAGIGRSALAEKLGKVVQDTDMTGRNLNTVRKLVEMVRT